MSVFQQQQEAQNIDVYVWQVITEMNRSVNYVIYLPYNRISFFYEHWSVDLPYVTFTYIYSQSGKKSKQAFVITWCLSFIVCNFSVQLPTVWYCLFFSFLPPHQAM